VSTPNDDEALLNIVQNSPFTDAVAAVNITNFPDSVWTARRRIKANNLRNYKAATKIRLTPRHMEARIGFSLQHLQGGPTLTIFAITRLIIVQKF
jgi:hypothetical protein